MLVRVVPYTVDFMKGGSAISWILAISLSTILELARKGGSMEPYLDPPLVLVKPPSSSHIILGGRVAIVHQCLLPPCISHVVHHVWVKV